MTTMQNQPIEPVSTALKRTLSNASTKNGDNEKIQIGHILQSFGVLGFAFLLMALALLNMAVFVLPGLSLLFGLPMVILAAQMVLGLHSPVFPSFVRNWSISEENFRKGMGAGIKVTEKLERFVKPRFPALSCLCASRLHAILALALAVMVAIPIPLLNLVPSLGIVVLALGLLQRDGVFIAGAYVIGLWSLWLFGSLSHLAGAVAH